MAEREAALEFEILHGFQQTLMVLLAPHLGSTKQVRKFYYTTCSSADL